MELARWYCVRSRQKQEHIAAANLRQIGVEVFNPRLRLRRATARGPVWFTEAVFPSYLFARFVLEERLKEVQRISGVSSVVRFGEKFPELAAETIEELRTMTGEEELIVQDGTFAAAQEVQVAEGAFQGLVGIVKQALPAAQRVRVLLEILGRETEVDMDSATLVKAQPGGLRREIFGKGIEYGRA
jgi:transcriptional antiterminator RfaH